MILQYLSKIELGRNLIAKVTRWLYRPTAEGIELFLLPFTWLYFIALLFKALTPHHVVRLPRSIPIWVIGNITIGGTGKTPMVIALAQYLKQHGYKPGILVRGYATKSKSLRTILQSTDLNQSNLPDEAQLIWRHTQCPIMICPDRRKSLQFLSEKTDCDIILADDGMQNHALPRHHEIAVIDGDRGIGNGQLLPLGPLREPLLRLRMFSAVIVKIKNEKPDKNEEALLNRLQKMIGPQTVLTTMQLKLTAVSSVANPNEKLSIERFKEKPIVAVAGIGNPAQFFSALRQQGFSITKAIEFPDHYHFRPEDFVKLDNATVIMTEKDAVKCTSFAKPNHWQVLAEAQLAPDFLSACNHWLTQPLA